MRIAKFHLSISVAAATLLMLQPASAQSRHVPSVISLGPAQVTKTAWISPLQFFPRISPSTGRHSEHSEEVHNEFGMKLLPGIPNGLVPGGMTKLQEFANGPSEKFPGQNFTGWVPPDPSLGVSPSNIVETVNVQIAFYTHTGGLIQTTPLAQFFSSVTSAPFLYDPKSMYDAQIHRFIVECDDQDATNSVSGINIAVSSDDNPSDPWFLFHIVTTETINSNKYWLDYPGFGYNKDLLVVNGNMFPFSNTANPPFGGVEMFAINLPALLTGSVTSKTYDFPNAASIQPAKTYDTTSSVIYMPALDPNSTSDIQIYAIKDTGTSNQAVVGTTVNVPTYYVPNSPYAQSTNGGFIDAIPDRVFSAAVRDNFLVTGHSTQLNANDQTYGCTWYEFDMSQWPNGNGQIPTVNQGIVSAGSGTNAIMPVLNINKNHAVAMVYTVCSPTITADMMVDGRNVTDPRDTMGTPKLLNVSAGNQENASDRWGDFWGLEVDPTDLQTFWACSMTIGAGGDLWDTWINSFKLLANISQGNPFPATSINVFDNQGTFVSGNVGSVLAKDGNDFVVQSIPLRNTGQFATVQVNYNVSGAGITSTNAQSVGLELNMSGQAFATGTVWFFNFLTNTWQLCKSFSMTPGNNFQIQGFNVNPGDYVDPSGNVEALVRVLAPNRTNRGISFNFLIDQATLLAQ